MTGVAVDIRLEGTERVNRLIDRVLGLPEHIPPLLQALTAEGESQTRRRIKAGGPGPDGEAWPAWSPDYAKTRHRGHGRLQAQGHLLDSITAFTEGDLVAGWGSHLVYAAIHQLGFDEVVSVRAHTRTTQATGRRDEKRRFLAAAARTSQVAAHTRHQHLPARPYLGLSDEDLAELEAIADAYVDRLLAP